MRRLANAVGKLNQSNRSYGVFVLCATTVIALPAQTFTTLHSFDNTDGASPNAALVQGTDANLYGTTLDGGAAGLGTVFKISPSGALTTLHGFDGADGEYLFSGLVQATNGDFYGTTSDFVGPGHGTVFKITPGGALTTLYSFCSQRFRAGSRPAAEPVSVPTAPACGGFPDAARLRAAVRACSMPAPGSSSPGHCSASSAGPDRIPRWRRRTVHRAPARRPDSNGFRPRRDSPSETRDIAGWQWPSRRIGTPRWLRANGSRTRQPKARLVPTEATE